MVAGLGVIGKVAFSDHDDRFGGPLLSRAGDPSEVEQGVGIVVLAVVVAVRPVRIHELRRLDPFENGCSEEHLKGLVSLLGVKVIVHVEVADGDDREPNICGPLGEATGLFRAELGAAVLAGGVTGFTTNFYDPYSYALVRDAYVADRRSLDDLSSVAHLQAGPAISMLINRTANDPNGVVAVTVLRHRPGGPGQAGPENNTTIRIPSANAKALGLYPGNAQGLDGTITFSSQLSFDYDRSNGITAGQIDFVGLATHELGHLLGFRSGSVTSAEMEAHRVSTIINLHL